MLAGTISTGEGCGHETHKAVHSDNLALFPLNHVRQNTLCQRHCPQIVDLHEFLVDIQAGVYNQRTLRFRAIVDQNVNLENEIRKTAFGS